MRDRKTVLNDLISFNGNLNELGNELSLYSWDCEVPLALFKKNDLVANLEKISFDEKLLPVVETWANLIECREDIAFEDDELKEYIYELANPLLTGENSKFKIQNILKQLQAKPS